MYFIFETESRMIEFQFWNYVAGTTTYGKDEAMIIAKYDAEQKSSTFGE